MSLRTPGSWRFQALVATAYARASVRAWILVFVATFTMAISYVDRQTLSVLAPTVTKELSIGETGYGLLASAFSIAYLLFAPAAGFLVDHFGARRGLLGAVLVWSAVAALHAMVPGFGMLFALRIALGVAEAPSFPGAAQTVHRALPPEQRARGFGVLFTGSSIGAMIAAPLSTTLEKHFGWRLAFLGVAVVGLIWIPIWLATAWTAGGRALIERKDDEPALPKPPLRDVLTHPAVLRAVIVVFAAAPTIGFVLLWGSKYLVRTFSVSQTAVGKYFWLPPLLFDLGAIAFGDLATRRRREDSPRALFAVAMILAAIGTAIAPFARGPWQAMISASIALAGGGGLFALLTTDMLARVPASAVSLAGGCTAAAQSLAYIVANLLIGRSVEARGHYHMVFWSLAAWTLPGCLVWLFWPAPPPYRTEPGRAV